MEEINKSIEEYENEEEKLKRLYRQLRKLHDELAPLKAKSDAIEKRKSEIQSKYSYLKEFQSEKMNLVDLKVKIKKKKEELKEADKIFDMENYTTENYAESYEKWCKHYSKEIDGIIEAGLLISKYEKQVRKIKKSMKKLVTNAAKMEATKDMKDQIPNGFLIQKKFSISEDENIDLESTIGTIEKELKELDMLESRLNPTTILNKIS